MKKLSKRVKECRKLVDRTKTYLLADAVALLQKAPKVKFDESVDMAVQMGIDPKQTDQMVRGSVVLPHGIGRKVRVAVFCKGEETKAAQAAGADFVGAQDLIDKIQGGWLEFDVAVATPDMMRDLAKLGKILGPRGLMPNPKTGTVTQDVAKAVKEAKAGKVEFKMNKQAGMNVTVGKISFAETALVENTRVVIDGILRAKPQAVKGNYIKSLSISTTMGPGLRIDPAEYKEE